MLEVPHVDKLVAQVWLTAYVQPQVQIPNISIQRVRMLFPTDPSPF